MPDAVLDIILYTYCSAFHVNPVDAMNTDIGLMLKMLNLHGIWEDNKARMTQKELKKVGK